MLKKRIPIALVLLMALAASFCYADNILEPGVYVEAEEDWIEQYNAWTNISDQISFWSNGSIALNISVPESGFYKFMVGSRGNPALDTEGRRWPLMRMSLGGQYSCAWEVSDVWSICITDEMHLEPGTYRVEFAYTNDYSNETEDRNLFIDGLAFGLVSSKDEIPFLMFKGGPPTNYGPLIACKQFGKVQRIPNFYPPKKEITYTNPTHSYEEKNLTFANGKTARLSANEESLNGEWKISGLTNSNQPFPKDVDLDKGYHKANYGDRRWDTIQVPLDWYQQYGGFYREDAPYVKGWYRKEITIPAAQNGNRVLLKFDVIGYEADLYVNGHFVGTHHGDFVPWEVDITEWVDYGKKNKLALKVTTDFADFAIKDPLVHTYGSLWWWHNVRGGLWQDVSIKYEPPVYINRVLVTPNFADSSIVIDYLVENHTKEKQQLDLLGVVWSAMKADPGDVQANAHLGELCLIPGINEGKIKVKLTNPVPWTPDNPYLYYLTLAVASPEKIVETKTVRFGYREFKAEGTNFFLNGERIYLFGENVPSISYGGVGKDEDEHIIETITGFKARGYNMIRTAHMPNLPRFYELADELGLMIYNEWSWSFSSYIEPVEFERRNLTELTQC